MLTIILAAFFFAYYFVNVAKIIYFIKKVWQIPLEKRIKPFDCVTCLSVWTAVLLYFMPIEYSQFICVIFGAGFIGRFVIVSTPTRVVQIEHASYLCRQQRPSKGWKVKIHGCITLSM